MEGDSTAWPPLRASLWHPVFLVGTVVGPRSACRCSPLRFGLISGDPECVPMLQACTHIDRRKVSRDHNDRAFAVVEDHPSGSVCSQRLPSGTRVSYSAPARPAEYGIRGPRCIWLYPPASASIAEHRGLKAAAAR